jgi:putative SOS response-associated peptidase YedK
MCGRYASVASRADLLERFVVDESNADELRGQDFNVTPTKGNPVVIARIPDDTGQAADPVRELRAFRWGLLPVFAKDIKDGARMINARGDRPPEAGVPPRLQVPASADPGRRLYEWLETDEIGKSGKKLKQPFAIRPADGSTLALAGLYEVWYDKSLPDDDPNRLIPTYTIITTTATDSVGRIHDRMPMAIAPDGWADWLDPRNHDVDQLRDLMAPPVDGSLDMYAVSKAVNNAKNNGPELLEPLPAEG